MTMAQQQKQGNFKMGPPGRPAPLGILLLFTLGMIVLPIVGFFASKRFVFEGKSLYKFTFVELHSSSCLRIVNSGYVFSK